MSAIRVHKFGGTSVVGPERLCAAADLIAAERGAGRAVVVCSAMAGVTNELVDIHAQLAAASGDPLARVAALRTLHLETLDALPDHASRDDTRAALTAVLDRLESVVRASITLGEPTPRAHDTILATGEKLAVRLLAYALRARGTDAEHLDADSFLETDDAHGEAEPVRAVADREIRVAVGRVLDADRVPVITGFVGRAPGGWTTTLGRGGSDLSATLVAAAMRAEEVVIWTDVPGVFSADPRVATAARVIDHLNYREAAEMSFYGAKVLHPRTISPVSSLGIPVRVRSTLDPAAPGTLINGAFTPDAQTVKAVAAVRDQALVSIEGSGMSGVPGVAARVLGALADAGVSATMISQSSSESSICLSIPESDAGRAELALKDRLRAELTGFGVEEISVRSGVSIVAVVGIGMVHTPGVAARVFGAVRRAGVNVLAIAQGSSELNISLAVDRADADAAVKAIHDEFVRFPTSEPRPVAVLGLGGVGRELVTRILDRSNDPPLRACAVADRSGFLLDRSGIPEAMLRAAVEHKQSGGSLRDLDGASPGDADAFLGALLDAALPGAVLADTTDAETATLAARALDGGLHFATANKNPLAGDASAFRAILDAARGKNRLVRGSATVGADLPILPSIERLIDSGDRVRRIEGCFSGTLALLCSRLEDGVALSDAVAECIDLGYTEPDPGIDLLGHDARRKAIILARFSGLAAGDAQVSVNHTPFVEDDALCGLTRDELLTRLRERHDKPFAARATKTGDDGCALRYVASVTADGAELGLRDVPLDDPLASLRGTDNMVVITTDAYADRPLIIRGPGAGADHTARAVLSDIVRIAEASR